MCVCVQLLCIKKVYTDCKNQSSPSSLSLYFNCWMDTVVVYGCFFFQSADPFQPKLKIHTPKHFNSNSSSCLRCSCTRTHALHTFINDIHYRSITKTNINERPENKNASDGDDDYDDGRRKTSLVTTFLTCGCGVVCGVFSAKFMANRIL